MSGNNSSNTEMDIGQYVENQFSNDQEENKEALESNAKANEGFNNLKPMSDTGKDFFARQDDIVEQAKRDAAHQEALESNAKANEGFNALKPMSETGKDFFARQDEIAKQAKQDAAHQEALESNAKANEGFNALKPMSETGKDFFARQDDIVEQAKRDAAHQEALGSNAKANEGFNNLKPMSDTGKDFFARQDDIVKQDTELSDYDKAKARYQEMGLSEDEIKILLEYKFPSEELSEYDKAKAQYEAMGLPEDEIKVLLNNRFPPEIPSEISLNEQTEKEIKKERNLKRAALITGVVAGGATAVIGGVAVVPTAGAIVLAGSLGSTGVELIGKWRTSKLQKQLLTTTNPEEKAKIEKKINNWQKVKKGTTLAKRFFMGGGIGLLAGSFISQTFMGGQGLIDRFAEKAVTEPTVITGQKPQVNKISPDKSLPEITPETPAPPVDTVTNTPIPEVEPASSGLIQNGRVDLPGSAWDGNLANDAVGSLPGEELNFSNYTGGWHEMAPNMLEKDLVSTGLTKTQLLDNLGTSGTHQLLNGYLSQIQGGVANPDLATVLSNMGSEGAKNLLALIK